MTNRPRSRREGPWVVFGAFDRHNLGDLLLPHVAAALLPGRELVFAGLAARDLRDVGGHEVQALPALAAAWRDDDGAAPTVLHAGGEVLSCSAWNAAAMLLPPDDAPATIALLEGDAAARDAWVQATLGTRALAPYAAGGLLFGSHRRAAPRTAYLAVGGVDLPHAEAALREEVFGQLRRARAVTVRDRVTLAHLHAAALPEATLLPDPAVMVAELFGATRIAAAARDHPELAALRNALPSGGCLGVQCSAEFADDATLAALADQLRAAHHASPAFGVALFRAGAAPWHDELSTLQRLAARLSRAGIPTYVFESLDVWAICALIARSRAVLASSLHVRIVALAFGIARVTMRSPVAGTDKHAAFVQTWDDDGAGGGPVVGIEGAAAALRLACAAPAAARAERARALARRFRDGLARVVSALEAPG